MDFVAVAALRVFIGWQNGSLFFFSLSLLLFRKELSALVAFQNKRRTVHRPLSLSVRTCLANQHSACRLSQKKKTSPDALKC